MLFNSKKHHVQIRDVCFACHSFIQLFHWRTFFFINNDDDDDDNQRRKSFRCLTRMNEGIQSIFVSFFLFDFWFLIQQNDLKIDHFESINFSAIFDLWFLHRINLFFCFFSKVKLSQKKKANFDHIDWIDLKIGAEINDDNDFLLFWWPGQMFKLVTYTPIR